MKITVTGRKVEVNDAIEKYIEKKYRKFNKFFDEDADVSVKLAIERGRHIVETTVVYKGIFFRTKQESPDMYSSVDSSVDALERQILKNKKRIAKQLNEDVFSDGEDIGGLSGFDEEYKLIKTKRFDMKPMDVDEAILQMELLEHKFFVFRNISNGEIQVVYKRNDGDYGLITAN